MTNVIDQSMILNAEDYTQVFNDPDTINAVYRQLAAGVHPDKGGDTAAFQKLNALRIEALEMRAQGRWGERKVMATIRTRKASHQITRKIGEDSMAVYYRAVTTHEFAVEGTMVKVAKSAKDNDLMAQEAKALKMLHKEDDQLNRHFPVLHDTFLHSEGRRRTNVTTMFDDWHSLATIHERFPDGMDPRHVTWMFRRLLMALGAAHDKGLIHGAVTPDNVIINARDHGVVLIDWCYSVVIDSESKTIKAVVPTYKDWYPPEVLAKEEATPATDLYMAARMMLELFHMRVRQDMIKPFRTFFNGVTLHNQSSRPQNAWELLKEFDQLLREIGEPFYPKRWVEFAVPNS